MTHLQTLPVCVYSDWKSESCDGLILVVDEVESVREAFPLLSDCLHEYSGIISQFNSGVHVLYSESLPAKRLLVSFTGPLTRDYDDIRRVSEAARDGIAQASKLGSTKPLLVLAPLKSISQLQFTWAQPKALCLSALLGALQALYVPLEVREFLAQGGRPPSNLSKVTSLGWFAGTQYTVNHEALAQIAWCLEEGRRVCRDLGGSDPERMCASRMVEYLQLEMSNSGIQMTANPVDSTLYPLASIVDRGSNDRHKGSIVHLEYSGSNTVDSDSPEVTNLFLIGKGIVYDTGGSDLKFGGTMATMHRDKCGAAAVAGFFKTTALLQPKKLKIHGSLAIIRNSIGSNAYVSDEIVISRAGMRVRINHTDAEGRLVMSDLLCEAKEKALQVANPYLLTVATLTRHVVLSYGPNYTGIMSNGPAQHAGADYQLQAAGSLVGEMHEISRLRREDYDSHKANEEYSDLRNSVPPIDGTKFCRGHQSPAAFMIMASGLDSHMLNSDKPLAYTHLDIAGSQGPCPGIPSGAPILTLASHFLLQDFWHA